MILVAQGQLATPMGEQAVIATTNRKHISLFFDAREWRKISAN